MCVIVAAWRTLLFLVIERRRERSMTTEFRTACR